MELLLGLVCRPRMAAATHGAQIGECFAEWTRRWRIETEYEPAARCKRPKDALEGHNHSLCSDKGSRQPSQRKNGVLTELLYPLPAKLDTLADSALSKVLTRQVQRWLPIVDAYHPQSRPGAGRLDCDPANAGADVKKGAGLSQRRADVWSLPRNRLNTAYGSLRG
jgi:hypothetical protein